MTSQCDDAGEVSPAGRALRALRMLFAFAASRWRTLREEYRVSLHPRTPAEARLVSSQLALVRESSRGYVFILPAAGGLIVFYNIGTIGLPILLSWWGALAAVCVGGEFTTRFAARDAQTVAPKAVGREARHFTAVCAAVTALWAMMLPALWMPGSFAHNIVLILIVASSFASSSSVNAPHFASARVSLWIYGVTLMLIPALEGMQAEIASVAFAGFFVVSMSAVSRVNFEKTRRMLTLEEERSGLIESLKGAKEEFGPRADPGGVRQPHQIAVPGQYEPRAAHADERHPGLFGNDRNRRDAQPGGQACRICQADPSSPEATF